MRRYQLKFPHAAIKRQLEFSVLVGLLANIFTYAQRKRNCNWCPLKKSRNHLLVVDFVLWFTFSFSTYMDPHNDGQS